MTASPLTSLPIRLLTSDDYGWIASRLVLALGLSVLLFPFGVLAMAALGLISLPKEPLLPPALGGGLENMKKSKAQLGRALGICCLGFLAFSMLCNSLDAGSLKSMADFARHLASYSVFPNQLYGNIDPKTATIYNSDYAVLRSMFISLFCPALFVIRMPKFEVIAQYSAGLYLLDRKIKYSYGWGFFTFLLCVSTPIVFFVSGDRLSADAGLIPRIYWLSGSILFSIIIGCAEIVGGMCLWVTAIIYKYLRNNSREKQGNRP